ncbi:MAG: sialidase family protein [Nocardioidaceae bacterium]
MLLRASRLANLKSVGLLAAVGLLAGGSLAVNPADAANPASGTVSDTSRSTTWTGGPFVVSNPTGTALDPPDCSQPGFCDDYTLKVDTSSTYGSTHQLKITVSWGTPGEDYDVYLLDGNNNSVSSAATSSNPEIILVEPKAGNYTVRVVPFAVVPGSTYSATAELVDKPANPAPSSINPPKLESYGAPESLPRSHDAGEPSIGNNWNTGATFYQAYKATYKLTFDTAKPPQATWTDVTATAAKGCAGGNTTSLDPILYTDSTTGLTLESQLTLFNSATCVTKDDGATWSPSTGGGLPSGVDHQTLGGGPYAAGDLLPHSYPRAVYYCSQDIATALCAISRDGGTTFGNGVPTYDLTQCGGLHGHIKVAPNDGTAYLPNKGCGANQAVVVSEDNGQTWKVRPVQGSTPGDSDPSVGIGAGGAVYFGYVGADGVPRISVSNDKGQSWKNDQAVGTQFGSGGIKNAVFPAVVAGTDQRAAFAFLGTTSGGDYQDADRFRGVWHLYVAYTYDGGASWSTRKVDPTDPVQRGSICTGGTTCGNNRNLLDFMDATLTKQGYVEVGYADGCTGKCVKVDKFPNNDDGGPYHDAYARVARQYTGMPLF